MRSIAETRVIKPGSRWLSGKEHPPIGLGVGPRPHSDKSETMARTMFSLKEVIQPHLPVQLPCYDFVPVTKPDLGTCLPYGLAQRLQSFSASMT